MLTLSPTSQQNTAGEAAALALMMFYSCGYFVVFPKFSLEPAIDLVFLDVGCESAQSRFYVPGDKLLKLEAILREATDSLSTRETSREMYEYVRSGTTGQPVHTPHAPSGSCI